MFGRNRIEFYMTMVRGCVTMYNYLTTFFFLLLSGHMNLCLPQCFISGIALMYSTTLPPHSLNCTPVVIK